MESSVKMESSGRIRDDYTDDDFYEKIAQVVEARERALSLYRQCKEKVKEENFVEARELLQKAKIALAEKQEYEENLPGKKKIDAMKKKALLLFRQYKKKEKENPAAAKELLKAVTNALIQKQTYERGWNMKKNAAENLQRVKNTTRGLEEMPSRTNNGGGIKKKRTKKRKQSKKRKRKRENNPERENIRKNKL